MQVQHTQHTQQTQQTKQKQNKQNKQNNQNKQNMQKNGENQRTLLITPPVLRSQQKKCASNNSSDGCKIPLLSNMSSQGSSMSPMPNKRHNSTLSSQSILSTFSTSASHNSSHSTNHSNSCSSSSPSVNSHVPETNQQHHEVSGKVVTCQAELPVTKQQSPLFLEPGHDTLQINGSCEKPIVCYQSGGNVLTLGHIELDLNKCSNSRKKGFIPRKQAYSYYIKTLLQVRKNNYNKNNNNNNNSSSSSSSNNSAAPHAQNPICLCLKQSDPFGSTSNVILVCADGTYSVFDLNSGRWLVCQNNKLLYSNNLQSGRFLWLRNRILVFSSGSTIVFVDLRDVRHPHHLRTHPIKSNFPAKQRNGFVRHGMTLLHCDSKMSSFSFVLYGGNENVPWQESVIQFDVKLTQSQGSTTVHVQERKLVAPVPDWSRHDEKVKNAKFANFCKKLENFGYGRCCLQNNLNQRILFMLTIGFDVCLYNLDTRVWTNCGKIGTHGGGMHNPLVLQTDRTSFAVIKAFSNHSAYFTIDLNKFLNVSNGSHGALRVSLTPPQHQELVQQTCAKKTFAAIKARAVRMRGNGVKKSASNTNCVRTGSSGNIGNTANSPDERRNVKFVQVLQQQKRREAEILEEKQNLQWMLKNLEDSINVSHPELLASLSVLPEIQHKSINDDQIVIRHGNVDKSDQNDECVKLNITLMKRQTRLQFLQFSENCDQNELRLFVKDTDCSAAPQRDKFGFSELVLTHSLPQSCASGTAEFADVADGTHSNVSVVLRDFSKHWGKSKARHESDEKSQKNATIGNDVTCFITRNHGRILMPTRADNIYNVRQNEWLSTSNALNSHVLSQHSSILLIRDELFIVSNGLQVIIFNWTDEKVIKLTETSIDFSANSSQQQSLLCLLNVVTDDPDDPDVGYQVSCLLISISSQSVQSLQNVLRIHHVCIEVRVDEEEQPPPQRRMRVCRIDVREIESISRGDGCSLPTSLSGAWCHMWHRLNQDLNYTHAVVVLVEDSIFLYDLAANVITRCDQKLPRKLGKSGCSSVLARGKMCHILTFDPTEGHTHYMRLDVEPILNPCDGKVSDVTSLRSERSERSVSSVSNSPFWDVSEPCDSAAPQPADKSHDAREARDTPDAGDVGDDEELSDIDVDHCHAPRREQRDQQKQGSDGTNATNVPIEGNVANVGSIGNEAENSFESDMKRLSSENEDLRGENSNLKDAVREMYELLQRNGMDKARFDSMKVGSSVEKYGKPIRSDDFENLKQRINKYYRNESNCKDGDRGGLRFEIDTSNTALHFEHKEYEAPIEAFVQKNGESNDAPEICINNAWMPMNDVLEKYVLERQRRIPALNGEFGVRAKVEIPRFTVVGQYTGFELSPLESNALIQDTWNEHDHNLYAFEYPFQSNLKSVLFDNNNNNNNNNCNNYNSDASAQESAFGRDAETGEPSPKRRKVSRARSVGDVNKQIERFETKSLYERLFGEVANGKREMLILDVIAKGMGNGIPQDQMLAFVNDCRKNIRIVNMTDNDRSYLNCEFVGGWVDGWPTAFLMTIKTVKEGDQLWTNYGKDYAVAFERKVNFDTQRKKRKDELLNVIQSKCPFLK